MCTHSFSSLSCESIPLRDAICFLHLSYFVILSKVGFTSFLSDLGFRFLRRTITFIFATTGDIMPTFPLDQCINALKQSQLGFHICSLLTNASLLLCSKSQVFKSNWTLRNPPQTHPFLPRNPSQVFWISPAIFPPHWKSSKLATTVLACFIQKLKIKKVRKCLPRFNLSLENPL